MGQLQEQAKNPLAGTVMMGVEAFSHRPVQAFYSTEPNHLWVRGRNGVQIQLYAPWIF